jgi:hypothetical protein
MVNMIYYEQEICGVDSLPKEISEVYRLLSELDPVAAQESLYSVEVALSNGNPAPRIDDE